MRRWRDASSLRRELFDGVIQIENGRIEEISERAERPADSGPVDYDFGERLVVPGFIDVHMHGLAYWLAFSAENIVAIARKQVEFGTTGISSDGRVAFG